MAITLTTTMPDDVAAFAPVIIAGTCSRSPVKSGGAVASLSITAWASGTATRVTLTVASGGGDFYAGDTVTVTSATGTLAQYNGRHTVYSASTTEIVLTTLWVSGTTAAVGTITRSNDNMLVRIRVKDATSDDIVGTVYGQPDENTFSIDISKILQSQLSSIFTTTTGDTATTAGAVFELKTELAEIYQSPTYTLVEDTTVAAEEEALAHRTTTVTDKIAGTGMLNVSYTTRGLLLVHFMTDKTSGVITRCIPYTKGTAGVTTNGDTTIVNKHGMYVYSIPATADFVTVTVMWDTGGGVYAAIKDVISVKVPTTCIGKRLYFLNKLGGYSSIEFVDYIDTTVTNKVDRYTVESWKERTMTSVTESRGSGAYMADLVDSPEVYDENGIAVEVLDTSMQYYNSEPFQITARVKYEQYHIS